jgi:hypothetical protein
MTLNRSQLIPPTSWIVPREHSDPVGHASWLAENLLLSWQLFIIPVTWVSESIHSIPIPCWHQILRMMGSPRPLSPLGPFFRVTQDLNGSLCESSKNLQQGEATGLSALADLEGYYTTYTKGFWQWAESRNSVIQRHTHNLTAMDAIHVDKGMQYIS